MPLYPRSVNRICGSIVLAGLVLGVLSAGASASTTIGSNLANPANVGTCGFGEFVAMERVCVVAQASQAADVAPGGLTAPSDGVIVKWRMKTGTTNTDVTQIKVGLRLFQGDTRGITGGLVTFPLGDPGTHSYDSHLPVKAGDRIGLDSYTTTNDVEGGDLPVSYVSPGAGILDQYSSVTGNDPPNQSTPDTELLLQAEVEPDVDHDGYGDETQDLCPADAGVQDPCPNRAGPRATVSFATVQDIIKQRTVKIRLTSNESGTGFANGKLKMPSGHRAFKLISTEAPLVAGKPATLRLRLTKRALKATKHALRMHQKVKANVAAFAKDAAGNVSAISLLTVRAKPLD
jgi:hypothetical protein